MHIAVAGNIGSGKTTLTNLLAKHFKWEPHYEDVVDNPYLDDFYHQMERWSFNLQIYFNEYETWDKSWGGQIHIGKKDEDENIIEVGLHYPINATFICVNNSNPLLYHKVSACDPTRNRYTFAFRYKID